MSGTSDNIDFSSQFNQAAFDAKKDSLKRLVRLGVFNLLPTIAPLSFPMIRSNGGELCKQELGLGFNPHGGCPGPHGGPPPDDDPPIDSSIFNLNYVGGLDEVVKFLRRNVVLPWLAGTNGVNNNRGDGFNGNLIEPAKGIIFYGPPGTGKTLMGKCLAGELQKLMGRNISFIMRRGTDTFSKWVGESEANLRKVFAKAEQKKPTVLFFDEIDGLVPVRRDDQHEHTISVVTTFLGLVDKVQRGEVFIIGATNRLDALDPAALRPGRFDKHIRFTPPNEAGRIHILNVNLNKWEQKNRPSNQEIAQIAAQTVGFTGADLEQLIRNAVNCAIEREAPNIGSNLQNIQNELNALRNVKVTIVDWIKAIEGTACTNANVFGSTIYCGVPLAANMVPLLDGIVKQVKGKCDGFLELCNCRNSTTGIKSFLCYGTTDSEIQAINSIIIPAVIGSFDSVKVKGFIAAGTGADIFGALTKAKTGALEKPSVLFIPRIDHIWGLLGKNGLHNAFLHEMEETRKFNLLIITSALTSLQTFPPQLQDVFQGADRSLRPRKPTETELREFLSPIFTMGSQIHQNFVQAGKNEQLKCDKKRLNDLLTKAVGATKDEEIRGVLTLHHELTRVLSQYYNGAVGRETGSNVCQMMEATIDEYIRTKFMG